MAFLMSLPRTADAVAVHAARATSGLLLPIARLGGPDGNYTVPTKSQIHLRVCALIQDKGWHAHHRRGRRGSGRNPSRADDRGLNITARMAAAGIPVVGVRCASRPERDREIVVRRRGRPICILRGHGITTAGPRCSQAFALP